MTLLAMLAHPAAAVGAPTDRLLWSDGDRPTAAAQDLVHELQNASERGLDPGDYGGDLLSRRLAELRGTRTPPPGAWQTFDVDLSVAAMRLCKDLHDGRIDPAAVGHDLAVNRIALDLPAQLAGLAASADVKAALDALEPPFIHYALLKRQLAVYRALGATPGLSDLPPLPSRSLKPGAAYAGAARLARLLAALGDLPAQPSTPAPFTLDPALVAGLSSFQARHGQKPDGVLGAATYAQLTRPLAMRVRQIELTMERWRWLPARLMHAPIIVNIPQFRLYAFDSNDDSESHMTAMDVIVGKAFAATKTPVFTADMTYLVFRPYWDVPRSIAAHEIVPAARRDPASFARQHLQIVRGPDADATVMPVTAANLELAAQGALRIRQLPGPDNALGLVKFMLPNPYNVYLHSTSAQRLFSQSRRDFSHGCIRVSDPVNLAGYVLRDAPEWTRERIVAAMQGATPLTVPLRNHIRVFIVYGTAVARERGDILFFDDIYGHDARLWKALQKLRERRSTPPGTESAGIQVHEIRPLVIAHAAAPHGKGMLRQRGAPDPGEAHVDGAALDMQAVARHAAAALVQQRIGLRRAVTGDHLKARFDAGA